MKPLGIIAALHEEIALLLEQMDEGVQQHSIGQRNYYQGQLFGRPCVVVLARIGKVAAAVTTVTLIREFDVGEIIFAGVAGSLSSKVKVGDIVVASQLLQHDFDASPIFPRYEIPLLGVSRMVTNKHLSDSLFESAQSYLKNGFKQNINGAVQDQFGLHAPSVHMGTIVSGDQFIGNHASVQELRTALPDALCVEMEGAAVAQVCYEYNVPFAVFRTISDSADDAASVDFSAFLHNVAMFYSIGVIDTFIELSNAKV